MSSLSTSCSLLTGGLAPAERSRHWGRQASALVRAVHGIPYSCADQMLVLRGDQPNRRARDQPDVRATSADAAAVERRRGPLPGRRARARRGQLSARRISVVSGEVAGVDTPDGRLRAVRLVTEETMERSVPGGGTAVHRPVRRPHFPGAALRRAGAQQERSRQRRPADPSGVTAVPGVCGRRRDGICVPRWSPPPPPGCLRAS